MGRDGKEDSSRVKKLAGLGKLLGARITEAEKFLGVGQDTIVEVQKSMASTLKVQSERINSLVNQLNDSQDDRDQSLAKVDDLATILKHAIVSFDDFGRRLEDLERAIENITRNIPGAKP